MTSVNKLLDLATTIALAGGELAARRRSEGVEIAASKSSLEDVVTQADRETETLIRSMIADARPNDGFLGEEGGADSGTSGLTWVVDPIDGTVNYLYGIRHYAVSIAVVEGEPDPQHWKALAGVVVDPSIGEVYSAALGEGARLDNKPIRVAPPAVLSQALVGTGFSYAAEDRVRQAQVLVGLLAQVRDVRRQGSAALDLCDVASGRLNAYFERGLNPWDLAAGALIASEAGALVTGIGQERPGKLGILAAEPALAAMLAKTLEDAGA